jgi:DNA-binding XRE family transcriptional regulator
MLIWAREQAAYSPQEAAGKAHVSVDKLRAWAAGRAKPSLRQAEKLAVVYHCAVNVLYLNAPAESVPTDSLLNEPLVRRHLAAVWSTEDILTLAHRYDVSPPALLARLADLKKTTWTFYYAWRADWEEAGGPPPS